MIQNISPTNMLKTNNFGSKNSQANEKKVTLESKSDVFETTKNTEKKRGRKYVDTFIKEAINSSPMLLAFTGMISVLDYGNKGIPINKALSKNFANFFLPTVVISSAVLSFIENKKKPTQNKNEENTKI